MTTVHATTATQKTVDGPSTKTGEVAVQQSVTLFLHPLELQKLLEKLFLS